MQIIVADDGRGVDLAKLREAIVKRVLPTCGHRRQSSRESELLEFLFLPGFSMKESVTDISGRGVGLDVVQDMVEAGARHGADALETAWWRRPASSCSFR